MSRTPSAAGPNFLLFPGTFSGAPVQYGDFLWALSQGGTLYRLSPRPGAKPLAWCQVPSNNAGCNRIAVANVQPPGDLVRGPAILAFDSTGVYAISLVQPDTFTFLKHGGSGSILANASVEEAQSFRNLGVGSDFFCYLFRPQDSVETHLLVRYFQSGRANEEPMRLHGRKFIGPVVMQGSIAVCTEEEVWVYTPTDASVRSGQLPANFQPYFARPSRGVNVPPGQIPFAIGNSGGGWRLWLAGEYLGNPNLLNADVDMARYVFHELPKGACICATQGGLVLNEVSSANFAGVQGAPGRFTGLQPGMPVAFDEGTFCYFQRSDAPRSQRLVMQAAASDALAVTVEDEQCNEDSCCTMQLIQNNLVLSYLQSAVAEIGSRGLKLAHWSLA